MIGFWIFMLIMELILPVIMVGFGKLFCREAPGEINSVFGYQTARSMRNRDTWEFAHHRCGIIWKKMGAALTVATAAAMLPLIGSSTQTTGICGTVIMTAQVVCMIASIFMVEADLKKTFDDRGRRK